MVSREGQTQAISIVMIMGIIILLVFSAYVWGIPLIEKREALAEFETAKALAFSIQDKAVDLANSRSGSYRIELNGKRVTLLPVDDTVNNLKDYKNINLLKMFFTVKQPLIQFDPAQSTTLYLGSPTYSDTEDEIAGTFGESSPAVITMTQEKPGILYENTIKINFRPLVSSGQPKKAYMIALQNENGDLEQTSGHNSIILSYEETKTINFEIDGRTMPVPVSFIKVNLV